MEPNRSSTNKSVGVAIATYNGEKYIDEQLESVINQSIKPDLIVISDGGSNDNTVNVCEKVLKKSGITYTILTSNIQLSVKNNFEKGILHCDTDFIFCADQDDYWLPTKIENFLGVFEREHADMVFSNAYITDGNLEKTGKTLWETIGFNVNEEQTVFDFKDEKFLDELNRHNVVTGMCMAFRGKYKQSLIPFSNNAIHDVWIAYKMNQMGKIVALNKPEVLYRQHGDNVIGTQASIKSSMRHKNGYYGRVISRIKFIEDVSANCKEEILSDKYNDYLLFLKKRKDFLDKRTSFLSLFFSLIDYRKYEFKWKEIVFKDIYIRWSKKD